MIIAEILSPDTHQKGSIAVFRITGMETHAIDRNAAGLGSGGDDVAAGAHAEGVDPSCVRRVTDELVGSGTERGMSGEGSVLGTVDQNPRMFDPNTHGKRLLHHTDALGEEGLDGVPGGMTDGQQNRIREEFFTDIVMGQDCAFHMVSAKNQFFQTGFKTNGATERNDFIADRGDDPLETVGTDMREMIHPNFLRRAVRNEGIQNRTQIGRLDATGKLSVGECSGTAFTKLYIRIRIEDALRRKFFDIQCAGFHRPSALDKHRVCSCTGQHQRGKETGRTGTDHQRRRRKTGGGKEKSRRSGNGREETAFFQQQ